MAVKNKIPLAAMVEQISQSTKTELDAMEQAIIFRNHQLFPEWELVSLSLPRNNPEERRKILIAAVKILEME